MGADERGREGEREREGERGCQGFKGFTLTLALRSLRKTRDMAWRSSVCLLPQLKVPPCC